MFFNSSAFLVSVEKRRRKSLYRILAAASVVLAAATLVITLGGRLIVAPDPLPEHADAAVVLSGSNPATVARFDEAVRLLERGGVEHVVLLVHARVVWGDWYPDVARRFIEREYDEHVAEKIIVCEGLADSTSEEAKALQKCLAEPGWESIVVVTSNYHTRRAKLIWNAMLEQQPPHLSLAVHGVFDGSFAPRGWWRRRRDAKTWFLETTKLAWYLVESAVS